MAGSAALFFSLLPTEAYLGDVNPDLMHFYNILKRSPQPLFEAVGRLRPSKSNYYATRAAMPRDPVKRAARFFYLIRLSWNGLYRVNRHGTFNVPYSGRIPKALVSFDRFILCSNALKHATLLTGDFEVTTKSIRSGDFAYFDPPYPRGAWLDHGFSRYSPRAFNLEGHRRLAQHASALADRGVHVLITEAARKDFLKLYSSSFRVTFVRNRSLIAADSKHRRDAYEAILTSYSVSSGANKRNKPGSSRGNPNG